MGLNVTFSKDQIVDKRTGVADTPTEFLENLRGLEMNVQRLDDEIGTLKANLKVAREQREEAVASMRGAIREGQVLPLLEATADEGESGEPN